MICFIEKQRSLCHVLFSELILKSWFSSFFKKAVTRFSHYVYMEENYRFSGPKFGSHRVNCYYVRLFMQKQICEGPPPLEIEGFEIACLFLNMFLKPCSES